MTKTEKILQEATSRGYTVNVRPTNAGKQIGTRVQCDPYDSDADLAVKFAMNSELKSEQETPPLPRF